MLRGSCQNKLFRLSAVSFQRISYASAFELNKKKRGKSDRQKTQKKEEDFPLLCPGVLSGENAICSRGPGGVFAAVKLQEFFSKKIETHWQHTKKDQDTRIVDGSPSNRLALMMIRFLCFFRRAGSSISEPIFNLIGFLLILERLTDSVHLNNVSSDKF